MPTISGLRRRGFPAEGIRNFATEVGVAKADSVHEVALLEHAVRGVLNRTSPRRFGVHRPDQGRHRELPRRPRRDDGGRQQPRGPVGRRRARSRSAASCGSSATTSWRSRRPSSSACRRAARCGSGTRTSSPARRSSRTRTAASTELRCDLRPGHARRRLARRPAPEGDAPLGVGPRTRSRPRSACTTTCSRAPIPGPAATCSRTSTRPRRRSSRARCSRPSLAKVAVGETVQFERLGYFTPDADSTPDALVFNRTLTLKDTWAKVQAKG